MQNRTKKMAKTCSNNAESATDSWIKRLTPNMNLLAIASANLGLNILLCLFNFYYVKVFLQHHHISEHWLYYAQITFLIGSFLIGPCIAYAQDYGCVMWRSRRRLILFVGPIFAIVFALPWFPWYEIKDASDPYNWAPGVHLTIVLLLWSACYFIVNACNCGLFAETTTDHHQRVKALTYNQIAGCIASSSVFPVDALSQSFRNFTAFQICCVVVSVIAAACFIFTGFKASDRVAHQTGGDMAVVEDEDLEEDDAMMSKSCPSRQTSSVAQTCSKTHFKNLVVYSRTLVQILQNRNFVCAAIANFMHFFRVVVASNFLAVYTEGLISDTILPPGSIAVALFYLTSQLAPRLVFIITCPLIRIFGARRTLCASFMLTWANAALGLFISDYIGYNVLIATLLIESILVVFQDAYVMLYAEVIHSDMRKHKRKFPVSTVLFTMTTLLLQPSTALAPMTVVRALNIGDFDKFKDNIRLAPPYTKRVMFLTAVCVPAVLALLSFVSLYFYKAEKDEHVPLVISNRSSPADEKAAEEGLVAAAETQRMNDH